MRLRLLTVPLLVLAAAVAAALVDPPLWTAAAIAAGGGVAVGWWLSRSALAATVRRAEGVQQVLAALPVAVLLFDDEHLRYANPEAERVFGIATPVGATPPDLGAPVLTEAVSRAGRTGETADMELERDGRQLRASASLTSSGEVALVVTDLTEIRRADAVRRDFVLNASHELKTPVASIQALADSLPLATERDPVRASSMIESLQREAARMGQLVRDLLDLVRLEERLGEDEPGEADLVELVRTQAARVADAARDHAVEVRTDIPDVARVTGSPGDVRIVVANLLDNAVAYNRRDGTVTVAVAATDEAVILEVRDTGIGISAADQERIFERFYRVDPHRSRRAGGTGLGLALVRHAVRRLGGEVELASTPGEGTAVTVRLPAAARHERDSAPATGS